MKRVLLLITSIFLIILVILFSKYFELENIEEETKKYNLVYEQFKSGIIKGVDIATVINKAINDNENALIKKDSKGKYITNDEDSVKIEIKISDLKKDKIYNMEMLYNGGIDEFVQYYGQVDFKCTKTSYNSKNKISYMLFEQVSS